MTEQPMLVIDKLEDLYLQATNEQSHYYTAAVIKEAIDEIKRLHAIIEVFDTICDHLCKIIGR